MDSANRTRKKFIKTEGRMTKTKQASDPSAVQVQALPGKTPEQLRAAVALLPSFNGAGVIQVYQANVTGKDTDLKALSDGLRATFAEVKAGDLGGVEAMLISQATALQTIFTSLARRAANQEHLRQYETFLGLALKAQSQSRATLSALVDLKYPRQATFVKQANIASGPQQVNNNHALADGLSGPVTHAKENQPVPNKLLEDKSHERPYLDIGATPTAKRSHQAVEAVGKVNRAKKPRG